MAVRSFEVTDIKCIDDESGDQGIIFMGQGLMITLVLDRHRPEHDKEICKLHTTLWNAGRHPITMYIQE